MKKLCLSLLIILGIINFTGCYSKNNFEEFKVDGNIPDQVADSISIKTYNGKKLESDLFAVRLRLFNKKKLTIADTFKLQTYNENGELKSTLTANKGKIDDLAHEVIAEGNVVLINESGTLKTEYLIQDKKTEAVSVPQKFTLIRENNTLYGKNLKSDATFEHIEMEDVSAKGKINKNELD